MRGQVIERRTSSINGYRTGSILFKLQWPSSDLICKLTINTGKDKERTAVEHVTRGTDSAKVGAGCGND